MRDWPSGIGHQLLGQLVLLWCEVNEASRFSHRAPSWIEFDVSDTKHRQLLLLLRDRRFGPTHGGANPCSQFAKLERFCDVVVGADV